MYFFFPATFSHHFFFVIYFSWGLQLVVLAESLNFDSPKRGHGVVRSTWHVTTHVMNSWEITILFPLSGTTSGRGGGAPYRLASPLGQGVVILIVVLWSLGIARLVYSKLQQRQVQYQALIRQGTDQIKLDTERSITTHLAHGIGGPLDAVNTALQILPEDELGPRAKVLVSSLHASAGFLSIVMGNIDNIVTQLGGGEEWNFLHLKRQPVSLEAVLRSVHLMLAPFVKPSVNFRVDCLTQPGVNDWVRGDLHRLLQIMFNLASNAIKYTEEGTVFLSIGWESILPPPPPPNSTPDSESNSVNTSDRKLEERPSGLTSLTTTATVMTTTNIKKKKKKKDQTPHQIVKITCSDTGPGISKQDQATVFQRLDDKRLILLPKGGERLRGNNRGIGLSITKRIVDSMDGSIRIVSDPLTQPGTRCIVKLPLLLWVQQPVD
jgi:signal transduction histidine kinase